MTSDAPVNVAECPPLGDGGTPSIYGKAQSHCLSTIIIKVTFKVENTYPPRLPGPFLLIDIRPCLGFVVADGP